jgi:hypothetical protein
MTSRSAARLVRVYPLCWRARYGQEFAFLLEQHPFSFRTFVNVLQSAGEAHMQAAISRRRSQSSIVGSVWSACVVAVVAGLILYGMVDDSPLPTAMDQSSIFAASWKVIQFGCVLSALAIVVAGLPLAASLGVDAVRQRRRNAYLQLAIPFISVFALVAWMAAVLIFTGGHWAASPWAVPFSRPDWPSESVRWITGLISTVIFVLGCVASAASVSQLVRRSQFSDLRIALLGINVRVNPLSFATTLARLAAAGIFGMFAGVVVWGSIASRLASMTFHNPCGPLGLSGLASWILSTVILGLAAAISGQAAWSKPGAYR